MALVHILHLLFVIHATSCLSMSPVDRVVVANSSTVFECSSNQSVIWSFRRTGQLADKRIYAGGQLGGPRYSLYRSSDDWYGLVISDVQLSDSGLYTCIDNDGFGPAASARLVVLDSLPICGANVSVSQPVFESQIIELRCVVIYAGDPPPRVRWTSPCTTDTVNSSITSTRQTDGDLTAVRLESSIVITATVAEPVDPYRYTITFFDDDDYDDGTESTASPMFIWNSSSFVVQYAVRNVAINMSDDEHVDHGTALQCHADGFPPARYEWRNVGTGRTFTGSGLRLDTEGRHTYECTATNEVANETYSARAQITLLVVGPTTTEKSAMSAGSTITAVTIATTTTAIITVLLVCCVLLIYRLFAVSRRRQRCTKRVTFSSSTDSTAVGLITHQQVRVSPPQAAATVFRDAVSNSKTRDAVSSLYDSIDEEAVGYEQLPDGRLSTVQQSVAVSSDFRVQSPRPLCCDTVDAKDATCESPRRTLTENDYLCICGESDGEPAVTAQAVCCLQGQSIESNACVRYVQPQQPPQDDGLYVNDGLPTTPEGFAAGHSDEGVYIHTLSDD